MIDLLRFYPGQIISYTDVKLKSVHAAKAELFGSDLAQKPCLDILFHGLRHIQFCGPLAVIALIIRFNAWLVHTRGKLFAVHDLHCLKLKETAARIICRHNVLRQLCMRSRGRSHRSLQGPLKDVSYKSGIRVIRVMRSKHGAALFIFCQCPVQQLGKRHWSHNITHCFYLLL